MQILQKVAEIAPVIKNRIQAVIEESQHADHVVIEICMTRTANKTSMCTYTLLDRQDERKKRRGKNRQEKKKEDFSLL